MYYNIVYCIHKLKKTKKVEVQKYEQINEQRWSRIKSW